LDGVERFRAREEALQPVRIIVPAQYELIILRYVHPLALGLVPDFPDRCALEGVLFLLRLLAIVVARDRDFQFDLVGVFREILPQLVTAVMMAPGNPPHVPPRAP